MSVEQNTTPQITPPSSQEGRSEVIAPLPIPSDVLDTIRDWAADDRKWSTGEVTTHNLCVFARIVLKAALVSSVSPLVYPRVEDTSPVLARVEPDAVKAALGAEESVSPHVERWQPIETAPRDGTTVLLWWRAEVGSDVIDYWASGYWAEFGDGTKGWIGESFHASRPKYWTRLIGERPTHWTPLPVSPHPQKA